MTTFRNPEIEKLWESWRKMREDLQDSSSDSFDPEKYGKLMVASWPYFFEMMCIDDAELSRDYVLLYAEMWGLFDPLYDSEANFLCDDYECEIAASFHDDLIAAARERELTIDDDGILSFGDWKVDTATFEMPDDLPY